MAYALFLSTPSARRATYDDDHVPTQDTISIHALREEGDCHTDNCCLVDAISIHALREEGDKNFLKLFNSLTDFYPRPPRGGRPRLFLKKNLYFYFYPRPPRGGRPVELAPRCLPFYFYPRPPRGGRPQSGRLHLPNDTISIHALREEGDTGYPAFRPDAGGFLSTPSARRATRKPRSSRPAV